MAGLADMEELLLKISNKDVVSYMREAMQCYGAGAMRGCIVLSYIALFDDMRAKLGQLAQINTTAKTIWDSIEKAANDQKVFETTMADQLQKQGFLTQAEYTQLEIIRQMRNRAAHPSGVESKPEDARFVFRTVIDDFLSKPLLKTTQAVDAIVARLDKGNFFPTIDIKDIAAISAQEIKELHTAGYPYLVQKLVDSTQSTGTDLAKNASFMLVGLADRRDPDLQPVIRKKLLDGKSHDGAFDGLIGRVIAADGELLKLLPSSAVIRIRAVLDRNMASAKTADIDRLSHPVQQISSILIGLKDDPTTLQEYGATIEKILRGYPYNTTVLDALDGHDAIKTQVVALWIENAGSSTFDTANAFADNTQVIETNAALLSDEDALRIISAIVVAAGWGAWRAKSLRTNKFAALPITKAKAAGLLTAKPAEADAILNEFDHGISAANFAAQEF